MCIQNGMCVCEGVCVYKMVCVCVRVCVYTKWYVCVCVCVCDSLKLDEVTKLIMSRGIDTTACLLTELHV